MPVKGRLQPRGGMRGWRDDDVDNSSDTESSDSESSSTDSGSSSSRSISTISKRVVEEHSPAKGDCSIHRCDPINFEPIARMPSRKFDSSPINIEPVVYKTKRKTIRGKRGSGATKSKQTQDPLKHDLDLWGLIGENAILNSVNRAAEVPPISGGHDFPFVVDKDRDEMPTLSEAKESGNEAKIKLTRRSPHRRVSLKKASPFDLLQEAPSPKPLKTSVTLTKNPSRGIAKTSVILTKNPFRGDRNSKKEHKW